MKMEYFIAMLMSIIIMLVITHLFVHKSRAGRLINKIPGPPWLPIFGNSLDGLVPFEELWLLLRQHADDYYGVYKLWLCYWPLVSIRHPDDVEILLTSQKHIRKSSFYDFLRPWLNDGLLTSTGNKWRHRRKMLTPAFHFTLLQDSVGVFIETSQRMVDSLKDEGGEIIKDVVPFLAKFSLSAICETAMGTTFDENDPRQVRYRIAVRKMGEFFYYRVTRPWLKNDWIFSLTPKGREQAVELEILHSLSMEIIERRKQFHEETEGKYLKIFSSENKTAESNISNYDIPLKRKRLAMLDLLIAAQKEDGIVDDHGIREEVDTFIFEGHDTTNTGMSFMLLLLAEHKQIQERARAEIDVVLKDSNGKLTMTELQKLTYLDRCFKESERLYPSVPAISRTLTDDLHLKNFVVPSGTIVAVHAFDVHRDPNFWPQPEIFDPDRFLPEKIESRHPFSYIPFSAGPRNCIGQRYAILELKAFVGLILHNFYLEPQVEISELPLVPDLILKSSQPLRVKFVPIER